MKRLLTPTKMKSRIATILIALSLLLSFNTFAITPPPYQKEASKAVSELLQQELEYPDYAKEQKYQCCVLVRVKINADGSFSVECLNCKDKNMKYHVKKSIEEVYSQELKQYAGYTVNLKISYKLI